MASFSDDWQPLGQKSRKSQSSNSSVESITTSIDTYLSLLTNNVLHGCEIKLPGQWELEFAIGESGGRWET